MAQMSQHVDPRGGPLRNSNPSLRKASFARFFIRRRPDEDYSPAEGIKRMILSTRFFGVEMDFLVAIVQTFPLR